MVVFFPSYNFLNKAKEVWIASKMMDKFSSKKQVSTNLPSQLYPNLISLFVEVFFEPDDNAQVDDVLQDYSRAARSSVSLRVFMVYRNPSHRGYQPSDSKIRGAMLFAVIGAKLSEGLNFSDDLARAVVIIGLPFANLGSTELQERMKYVRRLEEKGGTPKPAGTKDAGAELYENMCMNAVNQSIGRCLSQPDS